MKEYLVEIGLEVWATRVKLKNRIISYEEVLADSEENAKLLAFKQFMDKTKYSPVVRRKWDRSGLYYNEIRCVDTVEI